MIKYLIFICIFLLICFGCSYDKPESEDKIPPSKVNLIPHLCDPGDPECIYNDKNNGIDPVQSGNSDYNWMKIQWDGTDLEIDGDIHHIDIYRFYITIEDTITFFIDQIAYEPDTTMYIDKFTDLVDSGIQIIQMRWFYYIVPYDVAGNFTNSDTVSYKLLSLPGLDAPEDYAEFYVNANILFSWNEVSLSTLYRILFFDITYNLIASCNIDSTRCNIIPGELDLIPSIYIWRIDAFGEEYEPGRKSGSESEERRITFLLKQE